MKIVSLVPGASEILFDLGLEKQLIGVSHECNYPSSLRAITSITSSNIDSIQTQREIDNLVRAKVSENLPIYEIDIKKINQLQPDIIITQGVCYVCAISKDQVEVMLKGQLCTLPSSTKIISLNSRSFDGICQDILMLGDHLNRVEKSQELVEVAIAKKNNMSNMKKYNIRVLCLEWIDPYFSAGHWVPEQIEMAGFVSAIGKPGDQSRVITINEIIDSQPDVIAVICCGFNQGQNKIYAKEITRDQRIRNLLPFKNNKIFSFDSDAYFRRPTLRILNGAEQLSNKIL